MNPMVKTGEQESIESIEAKLRELDEGTQEALIRICGIMADCLQVDGGAVIITKSDHTVGFALVNLPLEEAFSLVEGAGTLMKEVVVGDIPPLGDRH